MANSLCRAQEQRTMRESKVIKEIPIDSLAGPP